MDMDRTLEFTETILELGERRPDMFSKLILSVGPSLIFNTNFTTQLDNMAHNITI